MFNQIQQNLSKTVFCFCVKIKNPFFFSASLFKALIHLITSSFFLFIRVIFSSTNFHFLETSSVFFSYVPTVCQFTAFEKITRISYSCTLILFKVMWSCTIYWDTKDFSWRFSTNNCLLTLNPLLIVLWP